MPTPISNQAKVEGYPIIIDGSRGFDSPYAPSMSKGVKVEEDCRKKLPKVLPAHEAMCKSSKCCGYPWGYGIPCYCACITQFGFCEAAKPYFSPTIVDDPGYTGPPPTTNLVGSSGNTSSVASTKGTAGPPNNSIIFIASNQSTPPVSPLDSSQTNLIDGTNQQTPIPKVRGGQFDASRFMNEYMKRYKNK